MASAKKIRVAIIGMGGFASQHHDAVLALEQEGICQLVAASSKTWENYSARREKLEFDRRGVRCYSDHLVMLNACREDLDVVTIPTPHHLHAQMHRDVVERGLAVYLEKPPTLDYAEFLAMLATEEKAKLMTNVAFNFIVEPERQALKQRILAGEFGAVEAVSFCGLSPRWTPYYTRNKWAGGLMAGESILLDSPMGNAMGHFVHNTLFWAGLRGVFDWAIIDEVKAELYVAHAIQGMDTVLLEAAIPRGPRVRMVLTHASAETRFEEKIQCAHAVILYSISGRLEIHWKDGRKECTEWKPRNLLIENFAAYFEYLRGRRDRPMTRVADSASFVIVNDLAYVASGRITRVPETYVHREPAPDSGMKVSIIGLEGSAERFLQTGEFLRQQGCPWAHAAGSARVSDLGRLRDTVTSMARAAAQEASG